MAMGKYERLSSFLRQRRQAEVPLTFKEIEEIIGSPLPPSARSHRAWWSNNPSNSTITKEWLAAGFQSEQVDMESERLVFRRQQSKVERIQAAEAGARHPLFGLLKGMLRIAPGTDVSKPADPDWGR
jgi:hypothetical protein